MENPPTIEEKSEVRSPFPLFWWTATPIFVLGGILWMVADLATFDTVGIATFMGSLVFWVTLGWVPAVGIGGLVAAIPITLGRYPAISKRNGLVLIVVNLAMVAMWCGGMEMPDHEEAFRIDTTMYARRIKSAGQEVEPGAVAAYLDEYNSPRTRYIALRTMERRLESLKQDRSWNEKDLAALERVAAESVDTSHRPTQQLAASLLVWTKLEQLEPGGMEEILEDPAVRTEALSEWLSNWEKKGRPEVEKRMSRDDFVAVQDWATERLPEGRNALQWSLENDKSAGSLSRFLDRDRAEERLIELIRMFCTTDGWSPLVGNRPMSTDTRGAIQGAISRMSASEDPLIQREAKAHHAWVARQPGAR